MRVDLNAVAVEVTLQEGKRRPLSVADVKEVLGVLGRVCRREPVRGLFILLNIWLRAGRLQ